MALTCVALIPARAGSKRLPGKNIKLLHGIPLLAYTIAAAKESGIFTDVIVSTEDTATGMIALDYGARWVDRPDALATDTSPDIEWVRHALGALAEPVDCFSILRPTSPFRLASTIRKAWALFQPAEVDSLRAVELCQQHPGKMWKLEDRLMCPLLTLRDESVARQRKRREGLADYPHSLPTQSLPGIFVQNGSLEIAWAGVLQTGSIAGEHVLPFFPEGHEGFDINTPEDWIVAEHLIETGQALPAI